MGSFVDISKTQNNDDWDDSYTRTQAMEIPGVGCLVKITTRWQHPNLKYSFQEESTFIPGVRIESVNGENKLVKA